MSKSTASRPRLSARLRAQRPQLVARDRTAVNEPRTSEVDPDVAEVHRRRKNDNPYIAQAAAPVLDTDTDTDEDMREVRADGGGGAPSRDMQLVQAASAAAPHATTEPGTALRPITYGDLDRMWDWAREDAAGAAKFLGNMPEHSRALQEYFERLLAMEEKGTAIIRAIDIAGQNGRHHIGFVSLMPINRASTPQVGVAHCYLCPAAQGGLPHLLPQLLDEAGRQEPSLTLMIAVDDIAFARLLQPYGFTLTITLTRPPAQTGR